MIGAGETVGHGKAETKDHSNEENTVLAHADLPWRNGGNDEDGVGAGTTENKLGCQTLEHGKRLEREQENATGMEETMIPKIRVTTMEIKQCGFRWTTLGLGIWSMIAAGSIYVFGVWSDSFAEALWGKNDKHEESKLNGLYQAALFGNYLPFGGFVYHALGVRRSLLIGASLISGGYTLLMLCQTKQLPDYYGLLLLAFFCFGHGTGYIDAAVVGSNLANFPDRRGWAMGLLKGYFGLSASVFTILFLCGLSTSSFMLVLGPVNGLVVAIAAYFSKQQPLDSSTGKREELVRRETTLFSVGYAVELGVAFLLLAVFIAKALVPTISTLFWRLLSALVLLLLFSNTAYYIVYDARFSLDGRPIASNAREFQPLVDDMLAVTHRGAIQAESASLSIGDDDEDKNKSLSQALRSADFWLVFFVLVVGMGSGLTIVSNASKLCKAKGGEGSSVDVFVSMLSIANCVGRVGAGWVADWEWAKQRGMSRPMLLVISTVIMGASNALLVASSSLWVAYLGALLAGLSYGSFWTLDPAIVADIFGRAHFGKIYGTMSLAPALGSLLISTWLASVIYESNIPEGQVDCIGDKCFRSVHVVVILLSLLASLASTTLVRRTRHLYS